MRQKRRCRFPGRGVEKERVRPSRPGQGLSHRLHDADDPGSATGRGGGGVDVVHHPPRRRIPRGHRARLRRAGPDPGDIFPHRGRGERPAGVYPHRPAELPGRLPRRPAGPRQPADRARAPAGRRSRTSAPDAADACSGAHEARGHGTQPRDLPDRRPDRRRRLYRRGTRQAGHGPTAPDRAADDRPGRRGAAGGTAGVRRVPCDGSPAAWWPSS